MPGGGWIGYAYDDSGRMVSCVTSDGYAESWSYDDAGRILAVVEGHDDRSECQYDTSGNLARIVRAGQGTDYTYDAHNRLIEVASSEGHRIWLAYDEFSNVRQMSDSLGLLTSREYDKFDRLVSITDPDGRSTKYGWNANGLLEFVREPDGVERTYSYIWQLGTELRVRMGAVDSLTRYEFDTELRLSAIRLPGSGQIGYIYNGRGFLVERHETSWRGGSVPARCRWPYHRRGEWRLCRSF